MFGREIHDAQASKKVIFFFFKVCKILIYEIIKKEKIKN
jgi:hypothetical protein